MWTSKGGFDLKRPLYLSLELSAYLCGLRLSEECAFVVT